MNSVDQAMAWLNRKARIQKLKASAGRLTDQRGKLTADTESILDFMGRVSPKLLRPVHFRSYVERLELAVGGGLRLVFAAPPQHGKTQTTLHALAKIAQRHPSMRHAYVTYSGRRARSVARTVRRILVAAGVKVGGTLDMMTLPQGGQIIFTSIDGGITGEPVDGVAIIDDPFKNRKDADSAVRRETVLEAYREAVETRVHPGASMFVLATRWHPDDLSGVLIREGWEYINLPAIAESNDPNGRAPGEALFPAYWSLESLEFKRRRVGEFSWAALYQGRPRPKGGKVFREATTYRELPRVSRPAYGVDLAYTAKTSADVSICCKVLREDRGGELPLYYVRHVDRAQVEAPEFSATLKRRHEEAPEAPMLWRASGTEKGSAQFIQRDVPLVVTQPPGDKLVSATDAAAAWNDGRVLVPDLEVFPEAAVWLSAFLEVIANFTGLGKERDDDVDALGNAIAALEYDTGPAIRIPSNRR